MIADSLLLIATTGPFGPTLAIIVLFPLLLVAPFALLLIAARSFLGADPIPRWLLAFHLLGCAGIAFLLWPARITDRWSGFWGAWRIASIAVLALMPVVLFFEAGKQDWFRFLKRTPKRRVKRKRRPSGESRRDGVFVAED